MVNNALIVVLGVVAMSCGQKESARNFNSDCGQVLTERKVIIESRNYPSNYPVNYQCSYLVKGPSCPSRFTLELMDFNVEESLGCSKDRLEVDDKDALCGNRNGVKEYFSEKGSLLLNFVSDGQNTGRGYRILVTRSECSPQPTTTQRSYRDSGRCCPTSYSSKKFILTSPNFPYSMSTPTECIYEIHRSNPNICRLRIDVHFFWLSRNDNCADGFLEIDGKLICGCKSDLKIIAPFEGQPTKIVRFVSNGFERASYSGFVMDVTQDECPNKVVPANATAEKKFRFYNDQINRVSWPNKPNDVVIEKLHLIRENTEVLGKNQPQAVRHVYFYAPTDFSPSPRDREDTEYLDTSSKTSFVERNTDYNVCRNWNQFQFNNLNVRSLPLCKTNEGSVRESQCVELNQHRGYFKSPGYPLYYPGNVNICYRFQKLPGYCTVRIHMKDFSLQNSDTCEYDYLLFANQLRYCGTRLINTFSTLDLRNKPYEQMNFVTDSFFCGRGFFGTYEQIPCGDPTESTGTPCSKTVQEERFTFEVYDYNSPQCSLIIRKYSPDVCSVQLYFEKFDLVCAVESLVIDGMMYCGRLSGQNVKIDVSSRDPVIVYKRSSNVGISGLRFRIRGVQEADDCPYPEVPAERFLSSARSGFKDDVRTGNATQFLLKMENNFTDICGVVTNITESALPETFCDIIMARVGNVTDCSPLKDDSFFIPLKTSQKIELKIQEAATTEEIEFQEIDCDSL